MTRILPVDVNDSECAIIGKEAAKGKTLQRLRHRVEVHEKIDQAVLAAALGLRSQPPEETKPMPKVGPGKKGVNQGRK